MAFLIVKRGDAEDLDKTYTLTKAVTVIGRRTAQNKPDIELSDDVVSRRHLEIISSHDKFWIKDLGSTNGTTLNDDRIISGNLYELKQNSRIGLGLEDGVAHVLLQFKESETTGLIGQKGGKTLKSASVPWLRVDTRKKDVKVDGNPIKLSKKEYELLIFLYMNAGNVCSRDEIIEAVWSESKDPSAISDATIDQLIHRLREKVEPKPDSPQRIISKKSFGYMLQ